MKSYENRSYNVLKYFYVFVFFYLPWLVVSKLVLGIETIIKFDMSGPFDYMNLLIVPIAILTIVLLAGFKKIGLIFLAITLLLNVACTVPNIFQVVWTDPASVSHYLYDPFVAVVLLVVNFVYFKKRTKLFNSETAIGDYPGKKTNLFVAALGCTFFVFLAFDIITTTASAIVETLYRLSEPVQKLLTYPYPGTLPYQTPYTLTCLIVESLMAATLVLVLIKAKVLDLKSAGLCRSERPVLSSVAGFFCGIIIVGFVALALMLLGAIIEPNKLFERIIFTIIISLPLYLAVGIFEEILFRSIMVGYFRKLSHPVIGVILSTLLFTAMHYITGAYDDYRFLALLFALGLFEAVVFVTTDNLGLCIGLHWGYDFAVTSIFEVKYLVTGNSFFRVTYMTRLQTSLTVAAVFLVLTIILIVVSLIKKKKAH